MKIAVSTKSFLFLSLFSIAGANAAWAADSPGDAQQQARLLLGGRNFIASGAASRTAAESYAASASSPVDAQEQGRQMILGRPSSRAPRAEVAAHSSAGVTANSSAAVAANAAHTKTGLSNRPVGEGGGDMARRMILRSAS
jgi:hypothetical protein